MLLLLLEPVVLLPCSFCFSSSSCSSCPPWCLVVLVVNVVPPRFSLPWLSSCSSYAFCLLVLLLEERHSVPPVIWPQQQQQQQLLNGSFPKCVSNGHSLLSEPKRGSFGRVRFLIVQSLSMTDCACKMRCSYYNKHIPFRQPARSASGLSDGSKCEVGVGTPLR